MRVFRMVASSTLLCSNTLAQPFYVPPPSGSSYGPPAYAPGATKPNPHARRHDGLYLRMGTGIGYGLVKTKDAVGEISATFEGTGLAIAEAYILAGELHACAGDFGAAFTRYEQRLMPFVKKKQMAASKFASSFAPRTSLGITFRNVVTKLMRLPSVAELFVGRELRDDIELPDYGLARL